VGESVTCVVVQADGSACPAQVLVGRYCPAHEPVLLRDIEVFKMVHEHFMQDVREFWQRSNFYLVVNAALVSVFASGEQSQLRVALAGVGLLISLFWFMVARGSIIWLRRWRAELMRLDDLVDRFGIYAQAERAVQSRPWESPSWITQWLPLAFGVGWLLLLAASP